MPSKPALIALIREGKTPSDKRVALSPDQCVEFKKNFPHAELVVQSSPIRCFTDDEYKNKGIDVVEDITQADILIGVKEVPISWLIPDKTYFFFSHTYKKQPYNRDLLNAILEKNVSLIDYELLTNEKGSRLIGFGRYAGVVGAYNGLRGWGQITGDFDLKAAHLCFDRKEVEQELKKVKLSYDFKLVMTGAGRVAGGIKEILEEINLREVDPNNFMIKDFNEPVFSSLKIFDYVRRLDGRSFQRSEFYNDPTGFESAFLPFAKAADVYMSGHYWDDKSPYFFTRSEAKEKDFRLSMVADISCDIDGPVASTIRPSTIADPFYGYDARNEEEVQFGSKDSIGVMAVDNLPGELPRDASEDFGNEMLRHILPQLFNGDAGQVLYRATQTKNQELTKPFKYLQDYVDGKE